MAAATERGAAANARRPARQAPDPQAVHRLADLTPEQTGVLRARQRLRNRATLAVLLSLVALFFALTISRMSQVEDPQSWSRPGAVAPATPLHTVPGQTAPSR